MVELLAVYWGPGNNFEGKKMNYATAPWKSCTEQNGDTDPEGSLTRRSVLQKTPSNPMHGGTDNLK